MPFQVGQVVTFVDGNRHQTPLNVGERYTVRYVSIGGTAIQVEGSLILWSASRFAEAPLAFEPLMTDEIATAVIVEDIEAQPPPPIVRPFDHGLAYEILPFYGCCGACVIYAKYQQITEQYLREVLERSEDDDIDEDRDETITFGKIKNIAFLIVNGGQHTRASQDALHACGFKFLTTSTANGGGTLYTYAWTRGEPIPFTPIERDRAFNVAVTTS